MAYALTVHKAQGSEFGKTILILPNPCLLLSPELLYTALTRQREKLIILYQGQLTDLMKFSRADKSETASRITNLFGAPRLVEIGNRFLEENLIHKTSRGEAVRSKSEVIIANLLHSKGIDYVYEAPFLGSDGQTRWPDFTIEDPESGVQVYWEHLGMLSNPVYRRKWERKAGWYREQGILPFEVSGGPNGILVTTEDQPDGGIDSAAIQELVREVFGL